MIVIYEYGVTYNGMLYGWKNKKLYRLPQMVKKRYYPLKYLPLIDVGKQKGYLLMGKRKSLKQLESLTKIINFKNEEFSTTDCPF